ncbi:hypothetical protein [Mesorhizobium sp. WSM3879]|uniref:hypothetical protein n=1 Tax=Mesorhizobium sp. WSM3879 TaxID=2029406 RepID=UPI0015CBD0AF|nr:hypothetical protein [Mesorhizobium sp. WSM3879]
MLRPPENEKAGPLATGPAFEAASSLAGNDCNEHSKNQRRTQRQPNPKWRSQRAWNEANPLARRAHRLVAAAIKKGEIIPWPCEECGDERVDCHHDDATNAPLTIRCLCRKHHRRWHAQQRKQGGADG